MLSHDALRSEIERFLSSCREPAAIEPGESPFPLLDGQFALEESGARLRLEVWDQSRHLARTIAGIAARKPGQLRLTVRRFGGKTGHVDLIDQARPQNQYALRSGERAVFLEQFRRFLSRQFPGWTQLEVTNGADLQHSLSPAYPRALLRRGSTSIAALAAPAGHADRALAFGLIWMDYARRQQPRKTIDGLALFLPRGEETTTCLRLKHLELVQTRLFLYDGSGFEQQVDPADHGNLRTELFPPAEMRWNGTLAQPEAALGRCVQWDVSALDAGLLRAPVYGQVCAVAGLDRGLIDFLAIDCAGRLAVIELKATEDLQLPLQALDYWIRVAWHAQHGEFGPAGYFPGQEIRRDAPRLLLAAPALHFHPSTETLLSYFSRRIEVERLGLSVECDQNLKVAFRIEGAKRPDAP